MLRTHSAPGRRRRVAPLTGAMVLTAAIVAVSLLPGAVPVTGSNAAAVSPTLVDESFTGATADSDFTAVGPACLTGAAPEQPPAGNAAHPLGGCPDTAVGPVPPRNGAPYGYLQLTDAGNDRSAAVIHNKALPANEGLEVSFDQWQYGGTPVANPADGISFFLVDGASDLSAPGAFGGSLGYAQKLPNDDPSMDFVPGVDHGYLGVGLDVLGNYFGDWEHRGNGCARRSPPVRDSGFRDRGATWSRCGGPATVPRATASWPPPRPT